MKTNTMIPKSNIRKFRNPATARAVALSQTYVVEVLLGDDDLFWVASTPRETGLLKRAGYEVL
jgi:hypothetical protein